MRKRRAFVFARAMIPQSFVQELLSRVDIVDVIERYLPLKKSGANYFACCPFHGEKSASFSVSPSKQFYHCFGCGVHGSAVGFLMEYSGLGFVDAIKELAAQVGLQVPDDGRSAAPVHDDPSERLYEAMAVAARFYRDQLKPSRQAIDYLKRRGLSGEVAARFGLGYAPDEWQALEKAFPDYQAKTLADAGLVIDNEQGRRYDRFRNRIIFPIHDRRGRIIAFGGRVLDKGEPKYLNSPETPLFEKGRELYGLFLAQKAIRDAGFAVVVEGYMDVVALAQFAIENAVATLGTATTPQHIHTLLRQTDRIVFCFDGDAAGRRAAWRALENALESLRDDATLAFLFLPAEHDPDSFVRAEGAEAFRKAALAATPLGSFLIQELSGRHPLDSAEGRAAFVHEAAPLVTRIAAPLLKLQVVKAVAESAGMTQGEVEYAFEQLAASAPRRRGASAPTPPRAPAASIASTEADAPFFDDAPARPQRAAARPGAAPARGRPAQAPLHRRHPAAPGDAAPDLGRAHAGRPGARRQPGRPRADRDHRPLQPRRADPLGRTGRADRALPRDTPRRNPLACRRGTRGGGIRRSGGRDAVRGRPAQTADRRRRQGDHRPATTGS